MKKELRLLDQVHIAKPCPANWNEMTGDDVARHCALCRKNVYDISKMTREEAVRLITETEGGVCVRLYRRADGTVLTSDCPKGLAKARQRVVRRFALAASFILTAFGCSAIGSKLKGGEVAKGGALTGQAQVQKPAEPVQGPPKPADLDKLQPGDLTMGYVVPTGTLKHLDKPLTEHEHRLLEGISEKG